MLAYCVLSAVQFGLVACKYYVCNHAFTLTKPKLSLADKFTGWCISGRSGTAAKASPPHRPLNPWGPTLPLTTRAHSRQLSSGMRWRAQGSCPPFWFSGSNPPTVFGDRCCDRQLVARLQSSHIRINIATLPTPGGLNMAWTCLVVSNAALA